MAMLAGHRTRLPRLSAPGCRPATPAGSHGRGWSPAALDRSASHPGSPRTQALTERDRLQLCVEPRAAADTPSLGIGGCLCVRMPVDRPRQPRLAGGRAHQPAHGHAPHRVGRTRRDVVWHLRSARAPRRHQPGRARRPRRDRTPGAQAPRRRPVPADALPPPAGVHPAVASGWTSGSASSARRSFRRFRSPLDASRGLIARFGCWVCSDRLHESSPRAGGPRRWRRRCT